jgi:hypothetical protein
MSTLSDREKLVSRRSSKQIISRRLNSDAILACSLSTWKGQEQIAKSVATDAMTIICQAYERKPAFLGSKSKKWILGGLFYLLGRKYGAPRTQKQIARCLDTNEMTIRDSYRNWLRDFPEFWNKS